MSEFVETCHGNGFHSAPKTIFTWLDWEEKRYLVEQDFVCLDTWHPPEYLTSKPNPEAADEFKQALVRRYSSHLHGWRECLDQDNSNNVSWHEFHTACKKIHFRGDVAGSWLALDKDLSGSISLAEIDQASS